jgi:hypothetical protein
VSLIIASLFACDPERDSLGLSRSFKVMLFLLGNADYNIKNKWLVASLKLKAIC